MTLKTGVCRPSELAHLVLRSRDPKRLVDFYEKFLNARVVHTSEFISFLTWDHEHHRLAILNDPTAIPREPNTVGMDHFALTFSSIGDLLQSYKSRKEMGIEPIYCVNHGMSTSMYYQDPDGNKIETQVDAYDDPQEAVAYMQTAEFAKDPRGPPFDPEDLLKRWEGGEDEKSLLTTRKPIVEANGQAKVAA